ncbi:TldD/PmbA family protein [Natranaerobius thermophilus]|uniref:Peptidase U62 modulator of DNA gyrase n=1 Tax=Natranaerobius thermophilus (strain ATCC BAA-1301 / DSM 18059 / JW/NM-WN-LF) TaxID=457570 RepID=B2A0X5_NATTJ|nr:TldD/PmbA family protein [Natranaerobius thermophilus]ACB84598.1 peptidase U62 modulator of DNA gyrase [Natranaerobius thermophilus JW/NM-WN-LF]
MENLLNKALKVADEAEVYMREVFNTSASVKMGEMKGINSEKKTEVALRIIRDGNMGAAVSTSLEDDSIIDRAVIALENQKSEAVSFPNENYHEVPTYSEEVKNMSSKELSQLAFDYYNRLKEAGPDIKFDVKLQKSFKKIHLLNSTGFNNSYDYTNFSLGLNTLTDKGFTGANKEYSSAKLPKVSNESIQNLIKRHRLGDHPVSLENEQMPVIFSGKTMGALMLRVLAGVNGENINKGISPVKDKLGEQLFSENITIRDDGKMPYGCNSCPFDDEGTPAQNTILYDKGVLKNYLLGLSQTKELDLKPTGNAFKRTLFSKEIEDKPSVFDSNLVVEGKSKSDAELIKNVDRGLLITGVMGAHTGNINQGDFSMNISSGYLIENGELVGEVKGSMIAGNIYDLFQKVEAVGTEYEAMRSIFYYMGYSPMVLFSEASIVGE